MISNPLNLAAIGDIHLGHSKTPTVHILGNLKEAFPDTPETGELDVVVIEGDLFDKLLHLPDPNVVEIKVWMVMFLAMCKKRNISIWLLEGTPSHDWKQSRWMQTLNEHHNIGADLHYVETLSIVHFERFGVDVLFVPDEWRPEPDDTWVEVQHLMQEKGLEQVDFAVMHGQFEYQLPPHVPAPKHMSDRYQSIVRHYVFIGHVHNHSRHGKILAAGSFDRLHHGEEEPKGHVRVTVNPNGDDTIRFIENTNAYVYRTVDCTGLEISDALKKVREVCDVIPMQSHVRVMAGLGEGVLVSLDVLKKDYPSLHFSVKVTARKEVTQASLIDMRQRYQPITITRANIGELLLERLQRAGLDVNQVKRAEELLREYLT